MNQLKLSLLALIGRAPKRGQLPPHLAKARIQLNKERQELEARSRAACVEHKAAKANLIAATDSWNKADRARRLAQRDLFSNDQQFKLLKALEAEFNVSKSHRYL